MAAWTCEVLHRSGGAAPLGWNETTSARSTPDRARSRVEGRKERAMLRVCAWCGAEISRPTGAGERAGQPTTHGICHECAGRVNGDDGPDDDDDPVDGGPDDLGESARA